MAFAASDVGPRVDLLLNGEGYMFSEPEQTRAQYGYTPTYVTRSNTQGDYGDNFQDFWLTATQRDWSLGDGQRFFRVGNEESEKRYFTGSGLDIGTSGQVNLGIRLQTNSSLAANVVCGWTSGTGATSTQQVAFSTSTTGYRIDNTGTVTSMGAHGLGVSPTCGARDQDYEYVSATTGGTAGVRKYDGGSWTTWSATGSDYLCYHNNTLYGWSGYSSGAGQAVLQRYDTGGVATEIYEFVPASGGTMVRSGALVSFGGKLAVLVSTASDSLPNGPELWVYDGVGLSKIAELGQGVKTDPNPYKTPMTVVNGVLFVGVWLSSGTGAGYPAVWYYANGNTGILWKSPTKTANSPVPVVSFNSGLLFSVYQNGETYFYNPASGGISKTYSNSISPFGNILVGTPNYAALFSVGSTRADIMYGYTGSASTQYAASGTLTTSQFDFESSLTKIFRGIKVEFETNSGTVDIAYQIDGVGGSYTTLQTGATSGTEYTISGVTGKTISVKVTLNGNGTANGRTLKRISVRAAPFQGTFVKNTYVLALGGKDGKNGQQLRDGTFHPNDGQAQATALRTVATTGTPVTIVDKFGSFTGVIENEGFIIREYRPEEYVAIVPVRQV